MEERNGFAYFLLGLGVGVATGILLAPQSGPETRDLIKSKAGEGGDYLKHKAGESKDYLVRRREDLKDTASELIDKSKTAVHRQKGNLSAAVEAGKQAYRDAVTNYETTTGSGEGV